MPRKHYAVTNNAQNNKKIPKHFYAKYTCVECWRSWRKRFYKKPLPHDLLQQCPWCLAKTGLPRSQVKEDYE
jgi:hypothetical protein